MKHFLIFVFICIVGSSVEGYKWTKEKISNPYNDPPMYCGLKSNGIPICDPEQQLEETQLSYINDRLIEFTNLVKCPCKQSCREGHSGLVIGFLIIREFEDFNEVKLNEANPAILQEFSEFIRKKWNLGTCDNSILITIATDTKQYGISIGARASQVLNDTWFTGIVQENFRPKNNFNLNTRLKDILYMFKEAITEELKRNEDKSENLMASLSDSNSNSIWFTILLLSTLILIILAISIVLFVILRHRKENDDVSLRDMWSKKFWLKAGNQYKEAKQSENSHEKDVEKNDDEEVKAKLASTEDLKVADDIENVDVEYPGKFSKV